MRQLSRYFAIFWIAIFRKVKIIVSNIPNIRYLCYLYNTSTVFTVHILGTGTQYLHQRQPVIFRSFQKTKNWNWAKADTREVRLAWNTPFSPIINTNDSNWKSMSAQFTWRLCWVFKKIPLICLQQKCWYSLICYVILNGIQIW